MLKIGQGIGTCDPEFGLCAKRPGETGQTAEPNGYRNPVPGFIGLIYVFCGGACRRCSATDTGEISIFPEEVMCEGPAGCKGEQPAPMRCECALSRNVCILIIYGVCLIPKSGKD